MEWELFLHSVFAQLLGSGQVLPDKWQQLRVATFPLCRVTWEAICLPWTKFEKAFFTFCSIFFPAMPLCLCCGRRAWWLRSPKAGGSSALAEARSQPLPFYQRYSSRPKRCSGLASCNKAIPEIGSSHSLCSSKHRKEAAKSVWSDMLPVWLCFSRAAPENHKFCRALVSYVHRAVTCSFSGKMVVFHKWGKMDL